MDWRLRGLPPALWRRFKDRVTENKADVREVLLGLMGAYANGEIDLLDTPKKKPGSSSGSAAAEFGARGGRASAAALTSHERSEKARKAATARWTP